MNPRRSVFLLGTACAVVLALALPAAAAPVDDKRAQAARIQAQIDANGEKVSAAAEAYNGAIYKLEQAETEIANAQARVAANEAETDRLRALVNDRAATVYKQAVAGGASVDARGYSDQLAASKYAASATGHDEEIVDRLADSTETLNAERANLDAARQEALAERDQAAKHKRAVESLNAQQMKLLSQVKGELATLIRDQERQQIAAAQANAAGRRGGSQGARGGSRGGSVDYPSDLPSPSPLAGQAIAFARAQLGKPYQYAASGPDSYDCSGLTMAAYAAAGLSLPHYSGAQYAMFPHVPLDQLAPGDLVFRGPGGSQHVALYIGNGLIITAPQTGDVVKVAAMGSVMGASRPG